MSYRNPEIIVDRSAEIFAQGMSNLGQTMVQGVQNIYKQREEQRAALEKKNQAINVFTQNLRGDYTKKISDIASGIKDKSFAEQYITEQTSVYEDLLKDQARLVFNPGSFSKEQIADLNKRIATATDNDNAAKKFATNITLDLEIAEDFQFGQSGSEWTFDGETKDNEMFKNMVFLYSNGNKDIPGIQYEKIYKNNILEVRATIDKENHIIKNMINSGVIDVNGLEDVDGKSMLIFSKDPKNYDSVFTKIDKGVDLQDAMLSSGIVDKSGKINDNFFEKEYSAKTSSVPGKDIITERGVFNEEAIRSNAAFKQNIEKQLLVLNKDNKSQKAWLRSRLNEEPPAGWDEMSTDNKRAYVTNTLVNETIEKLKGTLKSADGRSFEERTSLMNRPEPEGQPEGQEDFSQEILDLTSNPVLAIGDTSGEVTVNGDVVTLVGDEKNKTVVYDLNKKQDRDRYVNLVKKNNDLFKGNSKEVNKRFTEFRKQLESMYKPLVNKKGPTPTAYNTSTDGIISEIDLLASQVK